MQLFFLPSPLSLETASAHSSSSSLLSSEVEFGRIQGRSGRRKSGHALTTVDDFVGILKGKFVQATFE
jgi:hypothetical protein